MGSRLSTVLALGSVLWGCQPEALDYTGRPCDAEHACPGTLSCCRGKCMESASRFDWGDRHRNTTWQQWADGFQAYRREAGATLSVDACNVLTFTLTAFPPAPTLAVVSQTFMPRTVTGAHQGKLRGTFTVLEPIVAEDNIPFALIANGGNAVIQNFARNPQEKVTSYTAGNLLQVEPLFANFSPPLAVGVPYVFEMRWKQNAFKRLSMNGELLVDTPLAATGAYDQTQALPTELRMGMTSYARNHPEEQAHGKWELRDWELSGNPDENW